MAVVLYSLVAASLPRLSSRRGKYFCHPLSQWGSFRQPSHSYRTGTDICVLYALGLQASFILSTAFLLLGGHRGWGRNVLRVGLFLHLAGISPMLSGVVLHSRQGLTPWGGLHQ